MSELQEQGLADTLAAEFGAHEEVLKVEAGFREEGGVVEKIKGKPGRKVIGGEGENALGGRPGRIGGKERGAERCLGGDDLMREFFVVREAADESQDHRDIGGGGGTDEAGHLEKARERKREGESELWDVCNARERL